MTNSVGLADFVAGLDYPVSREDVLRQARERGADTDTLNLLQSLPAQEFTSAAQLGRALADLV